MVQKEEEPAWGSSSEKHVPYDPAQYEDCNDEISEDHDKCESANNNGYNRDNSEDCKYYNQQC